MSAAGARRPLWATGCGFGQQRSAAAAAWQAAVRRSDRPGAAWTLAGQWQGRGSRPWPCSCPRGSWIHEWSWFYAIFMQKLYAKKCQKMQKIKTLYAKYAKNMQKICRYAKICKKYEKIAKNMQFMWGLFFACTCKIQGLIWPCLSWPAHVSYVLWLGRAPWQAVRVCHCDKLGKHDSHAGIKTSIPKLPVAGFAAAIVSILCHPG